MFPSTLINLCVIGSALLIPLQSIIVNTNNGAVEGGAIFSYDPNAVFPSNINAFIGIPYAKSPIGRLRFKSPEEPDQYTIDPYPANGNIDDIAACPQNCGDKCLHIESEDCLTLSIYTPSDSIPNESNYPVMLWIHGGGFSAGSGNSFYYDPQNLMNVADENVIVVTINYRLGILGTLYDNTYNTEVNGNFGYQDQQLAIKYVHENIINFGGDPEQITIFGESAGAHSVAFHLLYNNEYINGGIMQSATLGLPMKNPITWSDTATQFSNNIGCDTTLSSEDLLDCWQNVDFNDILEAQLDAVFLVSEGYQFTPTVGTNLLPNDPIFEFTKSENKNKIPPFIVGTNKDEGYFFIYEGEKETVTFTDIFERLTQRLANNVDAAQTVLDYYGITETRTGPTDNYLYSYAEITTDHDYKCAAQNVLKNGKISSNTYHYSFETVDDTFNQIFWGAAPQCVPRTCHFADIYVVFTYGRYKGYFDYYGPNTVALGEQIQKWWTNYAATLDPNGDSVDNIWPSYSSSSSSGSSESSSEEGIHPNSLRIISYENYIATTINNPQDNELCAFWDSIGYAGKYLQGTTSSESSSDDNNAIINEEVNDSMKHKKESETKISIISIFGGLLLFIICGIIIYIKRIYDRKRAKMEKEINYLNDENNVHVDDTNDTKNNDITETAVEIR